MEAFRGEIEGGLLIKAAGRPARPRPAWADVRTRPSAPRRRPRKGPSARQDRRKPSPRLSPCARGPTARNAAARPTTARCDTGRFGGLGGGASGRVMIRDQIVAIGERPPGGREVDGQQFLLAADAEAGLESTHREVGLPAHDRAAGEEPRIAGPGASASRESGLAAIREQVGSSRFSGPTSTRDARSPTRGCASIRSAARRREPGSHQESSSLNATYGVPARSTPTLRAAAPRFSACGITATSGKAPRTCATVPSSEPLSTAASPAARCCARA